VGASPPDRGQQSLLVVAISDSDSVEGETGYSHNGDGHTDVACESLWICHDFRLPCHPSKEGKGPFDENSRKKV
jgi:hypothetical protein